MIEGSAAEGQHRAFVTNAFKGDRPCKVIVMAELAEIRPQSKLKPSFAGEKLDWIDAISRRAPPFYVPVGVQIVQHMNRKTRRARPTQERLAAITRLSVETVKRAVKWFEDGGWLRITRRRVYADGKWKTRNFYWLRMDNVAAVLAEEVAVSSVSGDTQTHLKRRKKERKEHTKEIQTKNLKHEDSKHEALMLNAVTPPQARLTQRRR
jgi:hypothetical protein